MFFALRSILISALITALTAVCAISLHVPSAFAQGNMDQKTAPGDETGPVQITPGTRMRISEYGTPGTKLVGTVVSADAGRLVLSVQTGSLSGPRLVSVDLTRVKRLEVSRGRKRHVGTGAGIGFAVGALSGAVTG